ncbi:polysaccharide deacetylase family protein [Paenibacillus physcomitrellae]|uniref:NodB homology domain-containing protein n=1 Tax=Paenibacillus physcomitrellae TaxID=1619311 RepID=A0ABQ1FYU5_9BACL|nr:polysaccharide deacetylase family protein [Paenibacillus physcomitrellae]GGA34148.1 hypothetical protein GCM10010917_19230 [Paenibacillus physcomitrellae]
MEAYSTQVVELLSLGKTSEGIHQMKVVVTHEHKQGTYVIAIDEFTFLEIEACRPLNGARARISLYPKWDPYRNTYYSSIIRTTDFSRETLYFVCSEEYLNQIKQMRQGQLPSAAGNGGQQEQERREITAAGAESEAQLEVSTLSRANFLKRIYIRVPRMVNLVLIGFIFLVILSIPYHSKAGLMDLGGRTNAANTGNTNEANGTAVMEGSNTAVLPAFASVKELDQHEAALPAAVKEAEAGNRTDDKDQPDQPQKNYEVIDVDPEKKLFGLPKGYVALTFDDGPSRYTEKIVDILTSSKVAATFLFIGENAKRNPDAVRYASKQGMSIGNHSWDHQEMTKVAPAEQVQNLSKTVSLLESLTHTAVTLFRPPYGAVDDKLFEVAGKQHMKTLMWNRDPEDWNHKKPEDILRYFHGIEASGGIYVLHEDKNTVEALPDILKYLKGKSLTFAIFK